MKNYHYVLIGLVFASLTFFFNLFLVDIRITDVNTSLSLENQNSDNFRNLGIVGRFDILRERILYGESPGETYEMEARLQTLAYFESDRARSLLEKAEVPFHLVPVKAVVNGFRALLGKEGLQFRTDLPQFQKLQEAYLWERGRRYTEAVAIYEVLLIQGELPQDIQSTVMLHRSFCLVMLNRFEEARTSLQDLIYQFPNSEEVSTARLILDFLNFLTTERARHQYTESSEVTNWLDRGITLYLLLDYQGALESLNRFKQLGDRDRFSEGLFYLGRTHEEMGQVSQAIQEYKKAVYVDPDGYWGQQAYLRLYMLGAFSLRDENLSKEYLDKIVDPEIRALALKIRPVAQMALVQFDLGQEPQSELIQETLVSLKSVQRRSGEASKSLYILSTEKGTRVFINQIYLGISPVFYELSTQEMVQIIGLGEERRGILNVFPGSLTKEISTVQLSLERIEPRPQSALIEARTDTLPDRITEFSERLPQWISSKLTPPLTPRPFLPETLAPLLGPEWDDIQEIVAKVKWAIDRGWWINGPDWERFEAAMKVRAFQISVIPSLSETLGSIREAGLARIEEEKRLKESIKYLSGEGSPFILGGVASFAVGAGFLGGMGWAIYNRGEAVTAAKRDGMTPDLQQTIDETTTQALVTGAIGAVGVVVGAWLFVAENQEKGIREAGLGMGSLDKAEREYQTRTPPGIFESVTDE